MRTSLLQNSSSQESIDHSFQQSKITKDYLQSVADKYMNYLTDLIQESDPKKQYQTIIANRLKQHQLMQNQNMQLLLKNKTLQSELKKARDQIKKLNCFIQQNNQGQQSVMVEVQSPSIEKKESSQESQISSNKIDSKEKFKQLEGVEQLVLNARQQQKQTQQSFIKIELFLNSVFERLSRIIELQKLAQNQNQDEQTLTVTVSREKYKRLLDFYLLGNSFPTQAIPIIDGDQSRKQVKEFNEEGSSRDVPSNELIQMISAEELEKLFQNMAEKAGISKQWKFYLQHRQSEAQKSLAIFDSIAQGNDDRQSQAIVDTSRQNIKKSISQLDSTQIASVLEDINHHQKQIESILFKKIKKLLKNLQFTQVELELFDRLDQKRQCGRLFDLDDLLGRFKGKSDLQQVSKAYTHYLVKTINFLLLKVMEVFNDYSPSKNSSDQYQFPWFIRKLDEKSNSTKNRIFQGIKTQCDKFLTEKKSAEKSTTPLQLIKQRKVVNKIQTLTFDPNHQLEFELVKIVHEYKELLDSCIFHCNREVQVWL